MSKIIIKGCHAEGNGGHGLNLEGNLTEVEVIDSFAINNGKGGFRVDSKDEVFENVRKVFAKMHRDDATAFLKFFERLPDEKKEEHVSTPFRRQF